jgi:hypothetical protein
MRTPQDRETYIHKNLRQAQKVRVSQNEDKNERKEKKVNLPTEQERRGKEGSEGGKRRSLRARCGNSQQ